MFILSFPISANKFTERGFIALDTKDYSLAATWFQKAADQGDSRAQYVLALMYDRGEGVELNFTQAEIWYRKSAEQGDPDAQLGLARMYATGEGVKQDCARAEVWYRKSAEQGSIDGQTGLAWLYYFGYGVKRDLSQALLWYRKSAEQGDVDSQYQVGEMYFSGEGIKQNYLQAETWYLKAAEQGHNKAKAKARLGIMYAYGTGVEQDIKKAENFLRDSDTTIYNKTHKYVSRISEKQTKNNLPKETTKPQIKVTNVKTINCPDNSSISMKGGCSCNDGYIANISNQGCVVKPMYVVEDVMDDVAKIKVCWESGYIPEEAYNSVLKRTQHYGETYIKPNDLEKLNVQTKIKEKRTISMFGIGCESAYSRMMELPKPPEI